MKWIEPNPDHPRDPSSGKFVDTPGVSGLGHIAAALADTPQAKRGAVDDFANRMRDEHPGLKLAVARTSAGVIVLSSIVAPERSKGTGTAVMTALVELADRQGDTIALTPSSDFGGSKPRLVKFYKRFGFIENKGRNRDYEISETMYRTPEAPKTVEAKPRKLTPDEQDLADELTDNGATVHPNGTVTLYHFTTAENAERIRRTGRMAGEEDGVFFTTRADAGQGGAGRGGRGVELRIPLGELQLDDAFGDEAHVRIPTRRAGDAVDVTDWLVP